MKEEWRQIEGAPNYMVSNMGNVKSLGRIMPNGKFHKERILTNVNVGRGYRCAGIRINGQHKYVSIHRLVASAFIGEIPEGMVINHLDSNPSNNDVSNLEITTQSKNVLHSVSKGRHRPYWAGKKGSEHSTAKPVLGFKNGIKIGRWGSIVEAKVELGIKSDTIGAVCKGTRKGIKGYTFKYENA